MYTGTELTFFKTTRTERQRRGRADFQKAIPVSLGLKVDREHTVYLEFPNGVEYEIELKDLLAGIEAAKERDRNGRAHEYAAIKSGDENGR